MIDYAQWSDQYYCEAKKILEEIERKKQNLKTATKDERKAISEEIIQYRYIYYDLIKSAQTLAARAEALDAHAA